MRYRIEPRESLNEGPCEVCGHGDCICPMCPICGTHGDPACYDTHGLVRNQEQIGGRAELDAMYAEDARLQAMADNADVYEEQALQAILHRDEGPCGRAICHVHNAEVDDFGACHQCMDGIMEMEF